MTSSPRRRRTRVATSASRETNHAPQQQRRRRPGFDGLHHHADPMLARSSGQSGSVRPRPLPVTRADQVLGTVPAPRTCFDRPQRRGDAADGEQKLQAAGRRSTIRAIRCSACSVLATKARSSSNARPRSLRHGDLSRSVDQQCLSQDQCDMRDEAADQSDLGPENPRWSSSRCRRKYPQHCPRRRGRRGARHPGRRPHDVAEPVTGPTVAAVAWSNDATACARLPVRQTCPHRSCRLRCATTAARPCPADSSVHTR